MMFRRLRKALGALGAHEAMLQSSRLLIPEGRPRVIQIRMHGLSLLVMANEDVGRRMMVFRRYEERDVLALLRLIRPDDICFDVGANTGYYTMLMASVANRGQVHAFEPLPLYLHLLSAGAALNGFDNVTANAVALGAEDGTTEFSESADGAYSSFRPVGRKPERSRRTVLVRSIDSYMKSCSLPRLDVVKLDIEGAEGLVLKGADRTLADLSNRPRVLLIELIDDNLDPYGESRNSILNRLKAIGYVPYVAESDEGPLAPYSSARPGRYENVFFLSDPGAA